MIRWSRLSFAFPVMTEMNLLTGASWRTPCIIRSSRSALTLVGKSMPKTWIWRDRASGSVMRSSMPRWKTVAPSSAMSRRMLPDPDMEGSGLMTVMAVRLESYWLKRFTWSRNSTLPPGVIPYLLSLWSTIWNPLGKDMDTSNFLGKAESFFTRRLPVIWVPPGTRACRPCMPKGKSKVNGSFLFCWGETARLDNSPWFVFTRTR